jgi:glyoxylase-like metal-dependent hydrolase (beta-lactamase superfamily II)
MKTETCTFGPFAVNGYLLLDDAGAEAILVDPGMECEEWVEEVARRKLRVLAIVNTHGHVDHALGNAFAKERLGAPLWAHAGDLELLRHLPEQGAAFGFEAVSSPEPDRLLRDGDLLTLGGEGLRVLHTPGHSPGGISLCAEGGRRPFVIVGDCLFEGSIGRTDLWGGDFDQLAASIREKLYTLPDTTRVLCGHGPETTIGAERRTNPFVRGEAP